MAKETYNPSDTSWTRSAQDAVAVAAASSSQITNSNGDNIPFRGVYVGVSGSLTITLPSGASVSFANLAAGVIHPIAGTAITTITTATGVVVVF